MNRRGRDDEPFLFDLPLTTETDDEETDRPTRPPGRSGDDPPTHVERTEAGGPWRADAATLGPEPLFDDPVAEPLDKPPREASGASGAGGARPAGRPASREGSAVDVPLDWDVVEPETTHGEAEPAASPDPIAPRRPGLAPRLLAAGVDALLLASVAAIALIGVTLLDARPRIEMLPGLTVLLLVFSFAYSVVPLAFWGATPGMAAVGLVARDRDGGPLTFGQTALRWFAGLLTTLLAGIPLLLALAALGGRSLADRLSRTLTWRRR